MASAHLIQWIRIDLDKTADSAEGDSPGLYPGLGPAGYLTTQDPPNIKTCVNVEFT